MPILTQYLSGFRIEGPTGSCREKGHCGWPAESRQDGKGVAAYVTALPNRGQIGIFNRGYYEEKAQPEANSECS